MVHFPCGGSRSFGEFNSRVGEYATFSNPGLGLTAVYSDFTHIKVKQDIATLDASSYSDN